MRSVYRKVPKSKLDWVELLFVRLTSGASVETHSTISKGSAEKCRYTEQVSSSCRSSAHQTLVSPAEETREKRSCLVLMEGTNAHCVPIASAE